MVLRVISTAIGLGPIIKPNMETLPWLERSIFFCLPHRELGQYASIPLDILAAIPYLVHFLLPVIFAVYLGLTKRRRRYVFPFLWCAGWVNFLAVIIQLCCPMAPPWFADTAVFDETGRLLRSANNEAGFERLDRLIGSRFFHNIYAGPFYGQCGVVRPEEGKDRVDRK